MPEFVRTEFAGRIAVLVIDNPPVNALGPGVWEAIDEAVGRAGADSSVEAIVLTGAGRTFIAGADIKVFEAMTSRDASLARSGRTHAVLKRMEDVPKPLVAAIHGHAFGGGLEIAMGCHYRVAASGARLGQLEVLLGLIPGAGGTQRLPRLCGVEAAIDLCTTGRQVSAPHALTLGLVDAVVDGDVVEGALKFAAGYAAAGATRKARDIVLSSVAVAAGIEACERAERAVLGKPVQAPGRAVHAIRIGVSSGFDEGSQCEREMFADCVVSRESQALRHLFFAERAAGKPRELSRPAKLPAVERAAVVGAGTMGRGIAMTYANAGIPVLLKDVDEGALQRALGSIEASYQSSVDKGRLTDEARVRALELITPVSDYDRFHEMDIVVEAVFEDLELKKAMLGEIASRTRPGCILASNTSTLDIDDLAESSGRPSRVVGLHFFSPAHVMKLLEIVRGRHTSDEVIAASLGLGKRLGKVPVVVGNSLGFVANRMLAYYMREAYLLLEEGASVSQIDEALIAFGMPIGPFGMQDIAGLDVGVRIRQHLRALGRQRADGPESYVLERLFDMGRYGQKAGAGWYRYQQGSRKGLADPLVETVAAEEAAQRGVDRRTIGADEIVGRTITAVINEGARILDEGFASRPDDVDVIFCYGFGFPRYRGGPLFHADTIGLPRVLERIDEYRVLLGSHWQPAPLLRRLVAEDRGFYSPAAVSGSAARA